MEERAKEKRVDLDAETFNKDPTIAKLIIKKVIENPGAIEPYLTEKKKKWRVQGKLTDSKENLIVDFVRRVPKTQEKERHKEEDKENKKEEDKASVQSDNVNKKKLEITKRKVFYFNGKEFKKKII